MKLYGNPKIKHVGHCANRMERNPREKVFAEEWAKQQAQGQTLEWLLCMSPDQRVQKREITQAEATCAATLIQWLGSPVGGNWLDDTLAKAERIDKT